MPATHPVPTRGHLASAATAPPLTAECYRSPSYHRSLRVLPRSDRGVLPRRDRGVLPLVLVLPLVGRQRDVGSQVFDRSFNARAVGPDSRLSVCTAALLPACGLGVCRVCGVCYTGLGWASGANNLSLEGSGPAGLRILYCSTSTEILTQPADFSADQTEIQCPVQISMQHAAGWRAACLG